MGTVTSASKKPASPFFTSWRIGLAGIAMLSILLYWPSTKGQPIWEDPTLINGSATGGSTIWGAFHYPFLNTYFRPLTSLSFHFDNLFARQIPFFFHQTNVVLHTVTALLLSCLGYLLTNKKLAGIVAGVAFAIQPAQVGATAWIGGRTDALVELFIAATLLFLVLYHRSRRWPWLAGSCLAFLAACLSKEQAVVLLAAVPVSTFVFGSRNWRDALRLTAPYLLALGTFVFLYAVADPAARETHGDFTSIPIILTTAYYCCWNLIVPTPSSETTYTFAHLQSPLFSVLGFAFILSLAGLLWMAWKRNRQLAWIALCGCLLYVPIANLIPVGSFWVAPYRTAESGTCFACVIGALIGFGYSARSAFALGIGLVNIALGAVLTPQAITLWRSPSSLGSALVKQDPTFLAGGMSYMDGYMAERQYGPSLELGDSMLVWVLGSDWKSALSETTATTFVPRALEQIHKNKGQAEASYLGFLFQRQAAAASLTNHRADAELYARDGLYFAPNDPPLNFMYGQQIIGRDRQGAIGHWEKAIKLDPSLTDCAIALAGEKLRDGKYGEARALLEPAMKRTLPFSSLWLELADAEAGTGDAAGAANALDQASKALFANKAEIEKRRAKITLQLAAAKAHAVG